MKRPLDSSKPSFSAPRDESKLSSTRLSEKTFNKKRFWLIVAILAIVEAAILCLALQWKYIFPSREVSELYTHYENVDGVDVSYIKDYKVNDTIFVNVTLIEATADSVWKLILDDFNIPVIPEEYRELVEKNSSIEFNLVSKEDPQKIDEDIDKNDILVLSRQKHSVCVFHTNNKIQRNAIARNKLDEI